MHRSAHSSGPIAIRLTRARSKQSSQHLIEIGLNHMQLCGADGHLVAEVVTYGGISRSPVRHCLCRVRLPSASRRWSSATWQLAVDCAIARRNTKEPALIAMASIAAENNDVGAVPIRWQNTPIANEPIGPGTAVGNKTDRACSGIGAKHLQSRRARRSECHSAKRRIGGVLARCAGHCGAGRGRRLDIADEIGHCLRSCY
jgi:hypothetical protein